MIEILIAAIFISAIAMSGFRRIKLLNDCYSIQSVLIAFVFLLKGIELKEIHFFVLFIITLLIKGTIIPYIINRAVKNLELNREIDFIINIYWSYMITGVSAGFIFAYLKNYPDLFIKSGMILILVGLILLIGRKKAISQMIGFLTMENGIVLLEMSLITMNIIIEITIVFEILVLALIMGIMIFKINKTFNSINTDNLSNLKG